ncbi:unnamed protein product [Didymodactylos carnosus]|uniref:Uncharacterized protein n=1 Tax=Didymodactylos carnosus TaxID=1234261 RepID=A0A8S2PEG7_9BILA|nr:unnamed protein product [Didymodactylos carnosus]CAF4051183.1 unnamed protein product [Didymodactylos carnosus]
MSHEKSEMHKKSIDISNGQLTRNDNNTVAAILNTVNMKDTTKVYLCTLARTFLFVLSQEFAFFGFEDFVKLQASNLSKLITTWIKVVNIKIYVRDGLQGQKYI